MVLGDYNIQIVDKDSMFDAFDCLHDAEFDIDEFSFDSEKHSITSVFKQAYLDDIDSIIVRPKYLIFEKVTFPLIKLKLELYGVTSCKIVDNAGIGVFTFNECEQVKTTYKLNFNQALTISLTFSETPKGLMKNIGLNGEIGHWVMPRNSFKKHYCDKP